MVARVVLRSALLAYTHIGDVILLSISKQVLDCSDVVIQVLDARNVPGTRCPHLERHLKTNASHKHLIFVINKVNIDESTEREIRD